MAARRRRRTNVRVAPSSTYSLAHVHLWAQHVGVIAESATGDITFEYTPDFRRSGLEISPIFLPLMNTLPATFPELRRKDSFAGLPGVFADCLPDAFGTAVIKMYFAQQGAPNAALSPVQKLLYIGDRAMGALEFQPAMDRSTKATTAALEVRAMMEDARRIIDGDPHVTIPEMIRVGASAGGARAKALVLWNRELTRLKSAFAPADAGDEPWILKFDGVSSGAGGPRATRQEAPGPFGRIEYAYARMANRARIDMPETYLLRERDYAHFMTKRFDRVGSARLHMHSLGGLLHSDYNDVREHSYEDYFRAIRLLGMGQPDIEQGFRRMVFNLAARNQDDHVKNLAFLMDATGAWRLAPAFDVTWAFGSGYTALHQMTANGNADDFVRADLLTIAHAFDLAHDGAHIVDEVIAGLEIWEDEAHDAGLDEATITSVRANFRDFS